MAYGYVGGPYGNTYVPTLELSGHLLVNYSRNMKLSVNRYSRITPVKQKIGAFLKFNPDDSARLPNPDTEFTWAPGTPSADGTLIQQGFQQAEFFCKRYQYPTILDQEAVDVANWDVKKAFADICAQTAMTHRIYKVCKTITNTANYDATHVASATTLNGEGFTDIGTTADPRIKKTLDAAAIIIQSDTLGRVKWGDLSLVINNNTALKWSQTRELREYLMQQPDALKEITLDPSNYNAAYGLPKTLYGFKLIVEDTYYTNANKANATQTKLAAFPDNKAVMLLAEGDLESNGPYSFNTVHMFAYEEMTVEEKSEPWDRYVKMRVVMNYDTIVVAPASGFLITNLFS